MCSAARNRGDVRRLMRGAESDAQPRLAVGHSRITDGRNKNSLVAQRAGDLQRPGFVADR